MIGFYLELLNQNYRNQIQRSLQWEHDTVTALHAGWLTTQSAVWALGTRFCMAFWCGSNWTVQSLQPGPWLHHVGGDFTTLFFIYVCSAILRVGRWIEGLPGKIKCIKTHLDAISCGDFLDANIRQLQKHEITQWKTDLQMAHNRESPEGWSTGPHHLWLNCQSHLCEVSPLCLQGNLWRFLWSLESFLMGHDPDILLIYFHCF